MKLSTVFIILTSLSLHSHAELLSEGEAKVIDSTEFNLLSGLDKNIEKEPATTVEHFSFRDALKKGSKKELMETPSTEESDMLLPGSSLKDKLQKSAKQPELLISNERIAVKNKKPTALTKIKLKQYEVFYSPDYFPYSITPFDIKNSKKYFKEYLKDKDISNLVLKKILNTVDTERNIITSALYYDFYLQRPDYAENFYKLIKENLMRMSWEARYLLADFYIKTDRGSEINSFLRIGHCSSLFRNSEQCRYYMGMDMFLNTGENKNRYLKQAYDKIPQAKELYGSKK